MITRRRLLALCGTAASTGVAGCSGTDPNGGDEDRACTDGPGCDAGTAARVMKERVELETPLEIEVAVDENLLSVDDLGTSHTTTAESLHEDPGGGEVMGNVVEVARWYASTVDDGFEIGDLSAEVIDSFESPDQLATYRVEHDWAEAVVTDEWTEAQYETAVLETFDP
jgi:hypothetical protein